MRTLSATEAFTPAIEHTKILFSPLSLRLALKLGLIALLAEMGSQFFVPPVGGYGHHASLQADGIGAIAGGLSQHATTVLLVIGSLFFLIGFVLIYFGSRMQLVLMDLVARRSTHVGPSWRQHAPKTWPWIGLKLGSLLLIFVVVGVTIGLPALSFISSKQGAAFSGIYFLLLASIACFVLVIMAWLWILRDFVLPFIVFEGSTVRSAVTRAAKLISREPGNIVLYLLMKFVLVLAASIAAELCVFAAALIAAIPLGLVAGALWFLLRHAGLFATAFLYVSWGLLTLVFLAVMMVVVICLGGATLVFYQAYALYFLGGRISTLGDLLEPPPPPIMEPAPPLLSPA